MKLRTLFMMALLFAGGMFLTGCGDNSASSASSSASTSAKNADKDSAKDADKDSEKDAVPAPYKSAVQKFMNDNSDECTDFKYEKTIKVTSNYVLICGNADLPNKGNRPWAFHLKKDGGKWEVVDCDDNWEPK